MHLTIAYSKIKKRNLVLINNATYQRETLSERPIRQPLRLLYQNNNLYHCIWATSLMKYTRDVITVTDFGKQAIENNPHDKLVSA